MSTFEMVKWIMVQRNTESLQGPFKTFLESFPHFSGRVCSMMVSGSSFSFAVHDQLLNGDSGETERIRQYIIQTRNLQAMLAPMGITLPV